MMKQIDNNINTDSIISKLGLEGGLIDNLPKDYGLHVIAESEYTGVSKEQKCCDRNICMSNEYNGIGCDECEVMTESKKKRKEPKEKNNI